MQRLPPPDARVLLVNPDGDMQQAPRAALVNALTASDLLVANDAATIPSSLGGIHTRTGEVIEIRLAGRRSLATDDVQEFTAVAFGSGDHRTRTEDRTSPPALHAGDTLNLGPLHATVLRLEGHPRLITIRFDGAPDTIWAGLAQHGRPIQYAHVPEPLDLWDTWTSVAAVPAAFEPPSAGFVFDWSMLTALRARGIGLATLTHTAGISSTGDPLLDRRLPLDEPYHIPATTVRAIERIRLTRGRVIAVGTTVTRALEHAAARARGLSAGHGLARQRIGAHTRLRIVDGIITGVHESGSSHFEMLRAFAPDHLLDHIQGELVKKGFRSHEFGDWIFLERQQPQSHGESPTVTDHAATITATGQDRVPWR
jgi:S-adenosylmethionine:tRNA ribosyltransferase-isomerase